MHRDVLVLEDDAERMKKIKTFLVGYTYLWVKTAGEAINVLGNKSISFSWATLDHDLEKEHYITGGFGKGTGLEVCSYIATHCQDSFSGILIHSLNPIGSERMESELKPVLCPVIKAPRCWVDTHFSRWELFMPRKEMK